MLREKLQFYFANILPTSPKRKFSLISAFSYKGIVFLILRAGYHSYVIDPAAFMLEKSRADVMGLLSLSTTVLQLPTVSHVGYWSRILI